ncbi:MAG: hypothetical protein C0593_05640 [Marinilabiliales bacterium]|nr:MAG: hypothetical protein C0593_05640 [Marinilabiliales bacterium]
MRAGVIISVIFLFFTSEIFSQTTISGVISGSDDKLISLYVVDDYLTREEILIDESFIGEDGSFSLKSGFDEVRYAVLRVGYYDAGIYLEPGKHYQLECYYEPVDDFLNPHLMETPLFYSIRNEVFEGLNSNIAKFNTMYDDFVLKNSVPLFRNRSSKLVQEFREQVEDAFEGYQSDYFREYVSYRLAGLEFQTNVTAPQKLAAQYLSGRPDYTHDEAMSFFNLFFDDYVVARSKAIDREDLQSTINYQVSYTALLDSLGKDTLLKNEAMRELVMLSTLRQLLGSNDYGYKQVLHIIRHVSSHSKFPEHRRIADNILRESSDLSEGALPPSITLNGEDILHPGRKSIMLIFFQTWNGACQAENKLLEEMYPQFSDKLDLVLISVDEKEELWQQWSEENADKPWQAYWFGRDYQFPAAYRAKAFPLYVLLNPDLTIKRWDIPRPSEGLPEILNMILK